MRLAAIENAFLRVFSVLLVVLCLTIVHLRLYTSLRTAIGNGDVAFVKFFRGYEGSITCVVGGVILCVCWGPSSASCGQKGGDPVIRQRLDFQ